MYLLRFDGFDIVGSSPEAHLKVHRRAAPGAAAPDRGHAVAGRHAGGGRARSPPSCSPTRRSAPSTSCSSTWAATTSGRVCKPGTVEVPEFATIERYSHVMHIVSTVVGELRDDQTAFDALAATFPAGTLSGAPKVRAMEIIEELEPTRRGALRRHRGLLRLRRRHGHGDRDPHRAAARRRRLRAGRRRASSPTPTRPPRSRRRATRRPPCSPRSPPPKRSSRPGRCGEPQARVRGRRGGGRDRGGPRAAGQRTGLVGGGPGPGRPPCRR